MKNVVYLIGSKSNTKIPKTSGSNQLRESGCLRIKTIQGKDFTCFAIKATLQNPVYMAAVCSALDNTGKVILKDHMRHCMVDAVAAGNVEAIDKFMK